MPYPYNNDLGKNPPQEAFHPAYADFPIKKKPAQLPAWASKPTTQEDMIELIHKGKTLKFPKVLPLATTKDYPGNHPANKYGKPDPKMIADDKVDKLKGNWAELVEAEVKAMNKKYPPIWNDTPSLPVPMGNLNELYANVTGNLSTAGVDPYYYSKKLAPQFLGKMMNDYDYQTHSNKITIKLRVDGLSVDNITFGVSHKIADHAAFNMNTDMLSHVLDEALAKLKDEIMRKVIMEATKK